MRLTRRAALLAPLAAPFLARSAAAAETIRIGQANASLSFLPIWAARAEDSFAPAGLTLSWAAIPGGDPACLAAVDAGDIDLAAVGSDTTLAAVSHDQPFVMVYVLMAKMSLEVVVSKALLKRTGVSATDPLKRRIGALKGAIIGVSAIGGAQDRTARWIAAQGGLDPKADVQVALVGGPPAIQAAMENGRIDAFVLSPPESGIAEAGGYGIRLVDPGRDFPQLAGLPNLVLAAKRNPDAATAARITAALGALTAGARAVMASPDAAAKLIGAKYYAKIPLPILSAATRSMVDGLAGGGRFTPAGLAALKLFSKGSGVPFPAGHAFWTNDFIKS
jgi:ABC-type nitrate/sulfonate/bicarbonate transport system substrate-binding protein